MFYKRFASAALYVVLFGFQPATTSAQSQNASAVRTNLRDTDPVDVGTVLSRGSDSVTVKNELFTRVFRINAQTEILRVDSSAILKQLALLWERANCAPRACLASSATEYIVIISRSL